MDYIFINVLLVLVLTASSLYYGYLVGRRKARTFGVIELVDGKVVMRNIKSVGVTFRAEYGEFGEMYNCSFIRISPKKDCK